MRIYTLFLLIVMRMIKAFPTTEYCNRTLNGQIGLKYTLRLTEPFQRFQPFICTVTFEASGGEYGDIVELTFLSFQIGSFEAAKNQTTGCYSGHLTLDEHGQHPQSQSSAYAANQQTRGYSQLMSALKIHENGLKEQKTNRDERIDEDEENVDSKIIMSPSSTSEPLQFGRFCGQMSIRSATYFSDGNNISLFIYVPSRASVLTYSFSLYLTYKFLPSWPAVTRYGPPGEPYELGIKLPVTFCDRVFDDCSGSKKCKIRSPNWPGFYNRNFTCKFWIRHYAPLPNGHRARIIISQTNEYKISLYAGTNSVTGDHSTSGALQSDCPLDVVRIYDGQTTQSPVLMEFCGSGPLPEVVSSRPEVLVVLHSASNQILYNSRLELNAMVRIERVQDSANSIERSGLCDFIYNASKTRSGIISTPHHSIPYNTTCTFKFISNNVNDRIWIYFISYFVQDEHHWSDHERCDVSRLEIYDYYTLPSKTNDSTSHQPQSQPQYLQKHSYCEKSSPKICGRAADSKNYLPLVPCTYPNESYLSEGSEMIIKQEYYKHDVYVRRGSFSARYEFINMKSEGNLIEGTLCNREIFSSVQSKGKLSSPKNLFLYGRGGRENVTCSYHMVGNANERVRIIFETIRLQSLSCEQLFDPSTNQYECRISHSNKPKVALLTLFDTMEMSSERVSVACLCNIVSSPPSSIAKGQSHQIVFDMIGSEAIVNFSLSRMSPFEDFNDYGFDASFEFLPAFDCNLRSLFQKHNGSEGEIQYSVPENYNFQRDGPFKCRWVIEASLGKHLYLKFKGHLSNSKNAECVNGNRFVVYAGIPRRPIATVCAGKGNSLSYANSVGSEMDEYDLFSLSWYNDSERVGDFDNFYTANYYHVRLFIEIFAHEYGDFRVRWLEVTKPFYKTQTGKTMRNINCLVECPELNACISPELWCDGEVHCPSGYDENSQHCGRFPTLFVATIGAAIVITLFIIIVIIAVYRFHRRRHKLRMDTDTDASHNHRCAQHDIDYYPDYLEYPRSGSELNFRAIHDTQHHIQYKDDDMPLEITRSFVPHYHNNVF